MLVVLGVELDEQVVRTESEVAFYDFRNQFQLRHHHFVQRAAVQRYTDVGADVVAQRLWVYIVSRAGYHSCVDQSLHSLVDGSSGNAALLSHVLEWDSRVVRDDIQNLTVKFVDFLHNYNVFRFKVFVRSVAASVMSYLHKYSEETAMCQTKTADFCHDSPLLLSKE